MEMQQDDVQRMADEFTKGLGLPVDLVHDQVPEFATSVVASNTVVNERIKAQRSFLLQIRSLLEFKFWTRPMGIRALRLRMGLPHDSNLSYRVNQSGVLGVHIPVIGDAILFFQKDRGGPHKLKFNSRGIAFGVVCEIADNYIRFVGEDLNIYTTHAGQGILIMRDMLHLTEQWAIKIRAKRREWSNLRRIVKTICTVDDYTPNHYVSDYLCALLNGPNMHPAHSSQRGQFAYVWLRDTINGYSRPLIKGNEKDLYLHLKTSIKDFRKLTNREMDMYQIAINSLDK